MRGVVFLSMTFLVPLGLLFLTNWVVTSSYLDVNDLKVLADEGKIPYEVYRLAFYKSFENPKLVYVVEGNRVMANTLRDWISVGGSWDVLEGKYVEKINDTWVKVVFVNYDQALTNDYIIVKVDVSLQGNGYVLGSYFPKYLKIQNHTSGTWRLGNATLPKVYDFASGEVSIDFYLNPNEEDWKYAETIANQIVDYLKKKGFNVTPGNAILMVKEISRLYPYKADLSPHKPFYVKVLDGNNLTQIVVSETGSLIKSILLSEWANCYYYATFDQYVLVSLGLPAYIFIYDTPGNYHAEVLIPHELARDPQLDYLEVYIDKNAHVEKYDIVYYPWYNSPSEPLSGKSWVIGVSKTS